MEFTIQSKALYSTWILYKPNRILFDAGEGVSSKLGNKIYSIEKIFLTHSHVDHIAGLWGIINTRNNAMGSREKSLKIYYPKNSQQIQKYIDFINNANNGMKYDLEFIEIDLDSEIQLSDNRFIKPFKTNHTPREYSLGYQILETRKKLKDEFKHLSKKEIVDIVNDKGRDFISEKYIASILTISGDSLPIAEELAYDSEILLHECTFFFESDRKIRNHTSLNELKELLRKIKTKRVIIYHVSSRYNFIIKETEERLKKEFPDKEIYVVHPEKIFKI